MAYIVETQIGNGNWTPVFNLDRYRAETDAKRIAQIAFGIETTDRLRVRPEGTKAPIALFETGQRAAMMLFAMTRGPFDPKPS